jgi:hypothetical protein
MFESIGEELPRSKHPKNPKNDFLNTVGRRETPAKHSDFKLGHYTCTTATAASRGSCKNNLAEVLNPIEARVAMSNVARLPDRGRAFVAVLASAAFLWTLVLSVSPQLHERIHPDANRIDHTCAVTFIATGNCNHSGPAPLLSAPALVVQSSTIPTLTPQWVESPFLVASVFEHAPPTLV